MLNLITVVFKDELPLLEIQANSISQYVNSSDINSITVVVNDVDNVADLINLSWWKQYQSRVQVIPYSKWNYTCRINGWENQQLLKLLAASESTTKWSMVLDAKTWFVKPLDTSALFDLQGRSNSGLVPIFHGFEESQHFVENYYGISMKQVVGPGGVPFIFHTETVKGLVNSVEDFIDFFQTSCRYPHLVTEFHLYSGYILSQYNKYDELYSEFCAYSPVNIAHWQTDDFDNLIRSMQNPETLTVSIHRKAYQHLTPDQITYWVEFLKEKHLITNKKETHDAINTYIK